MLELKGLELVAIILKASSPGKFDFIGFAIQGLSRYEKIYVIINFRLKLNRKLVDFVLYSISFHNIILFKLFILYQSVSFKILGLSWKFKLCMKVFMYGLHWFHWGLDFRTLELPPTVSTRAAALRSDAETRRYNHETHETYEKIRFYSHRMHRLHKKRDTNEYLL